MEYYMWLSARERPGKRCVRFERFQLSPAADFHRISQICRRQTNLPQTTSEHQARKSWMSRKGRISFFRARIVPFPGDRSRRR